MKRNKTLSVIGSIIQHLIKRFMLFHNIYIYRSDNFSGNGHTFLMIVLWSTSCGQWEQFMQNFVLLGPSGGQRELFLEIVLHQWGTIPWGTAGLIVETTYSLHAQLRSLH